MGSDICYQKTFINQRHILS